MQMECFVTGGSGFIGQHLLAHLTARGHRCQVLMRSAQAQGRLAEQVGLLGGEASRLVFVRGDISQPGLGLSTADQQGMASVRLVFHLAVQFAWGLTLDQARAVNVQGPLNVARWAAERGCRLLMVGGYMLENHEHMKALGIGLEAVDATDWPRVYRRAGGYEGSKMEAHFAVLQYLRQVGGHYTIVHPATVCGHSRTGHILAGQPLVALMRNLAGGRLKAIPGSPDHWLPLVSVDYLVALMGAVAIDPDMVNQQVLALDADTPALGGLLERVAPTLGVRAPHRYVALGVLRGLLRVPGVSALLNTSPESLDFIQTTRFDMSNTRRLDRRYALRHPDIGLALDNTARFVRHSLLA